MPVRIEPFRREQAPAFDALNRAWLVGYDLLEPPDEEQLSDPWTHILGPGGQIFVAVRSAEVVGTCAIVPLQDGTCELVKLAVSPAARGLGIGRRLVKACLDYAREKGLSRVVLLSNSQLRPAIHLYQALGFRHRPVPADAHYRTADIYMELVLDEPAE
jgi:ribosomal protein S18 acetylase RimI-like enzyme